jgi:hypothetical protein
MPEIETTKLRSISQELRHRLEQANIVVVPDHNEPEHLKMRQEGVLAIYHMVGSEHDARRSGLLKGPVQCETL